MGKVGHMKGLLSNFWGIMGLVILWQIIALLARKPFIPLPVDVFKVFIGLLSKGLMQHLSASFTRVIAGLIFSVLVAVPLGYILGRVALMDKILSPLIFLLYPIPKIAFLPIILLLFGIGNNSSVFIIILITFFQILIGVRDGIKSLPQEYFHGVVSLKGSEIDIYRHIIIPGTVPNIISSLRISLGTALAILFFAETQAISGFGIGYFIFDAMLRVSYKEMFAGIIGIALMGYLLYKVIDWLEIIMCPYIMYNTRLH